MKIGHSNILLKRRSEVDPPSPVIQIFGQLIFGASFQSTNSFKNQKKYRKPRAFGARTPLLGAEGPQKWEYPPPSRKKNWETTRKKPRSGDYNQRYCWEGAPV